MTRWEVTKAVRRSDLPSSSRLIMLTLADVAEVGTAEIPEQWTPSLAVLASETGLTRTTVRTHLERLEVAGWIKRNRPSKKAQWHGERVRYALLIPVGGGSTIDPPSGSTSDQVGQSVTTGGSMVNHKGVNGCPPNQILIETDRGERSSPPNDQLFDVDEPAQSPKSNTILAEWIDHCTAHNVKLSSRVKARYGERIKAALGEGFAPELIRAALIRMRERGQAGSPAQLDGFLVDVQAPATARAAALPASSAPQRIPESEKCEHLKRATTCGLCRAEREGAKTT